MLGAFENFPDCLVNRCADRNRHPTLSEWKATPLPSDTSIFERALELISARRVDATCRGMHEQNSNLLRHLNLQVGSGTGEKPAGAEVRMRVGPSRDLPCAVP